MEGGFSSKQQLKFAITGLATRDLEGVSVATARAVLREVRHKPAHLKAAISDILSGIDAAPKHAARCRLQLAEFAVLECVSHQQLIQLLPSLTQQANIVLAAHRQDAACINSLAALLTSCVAKLLHGALGSYAAMHGPQAGSVQAAAAELVTADYMCTALLHPVIKSTYRDPEQTRVSAGSVVLLGLCEVLKAHTDQAEVIEAVRRSLGLMLQLMSAGTVALRAPGVFLPVCCCVEVLGLSLSRDDTRRLLKIALKAACMQGGSWQVRRDACQALAVLAASLQFRAVLEPTAASEAAAATELVLTPAVELLIAQKPSVMQVLEDARYDKIAAVRATAAAAWGEFRSLPDPVAADDATPAGKADKTGSHRGQGGGGSNSAKHRGSAKRALGHAAGMQSPNRRRPLPPRFVRPQMLPPADELDFGVLVFAPPYPPPPPVASPEPAAEAAVAAADTSQAHGADQSPVARQLLFDGVTSVRASVDASSQTCGGEGAAPAHPPYTVQSPQAHGSSPLFATSSSLSPGARSAEQAELQQFLQQQQASGLPALLAAAASGVSGSIPGSPVRLDVSHHVHGRVELGITYSAAGTSSPAGVGVGAGVGAAQGSPGGLPQHQQQHGSPVAAAAAAAELLSAAAGDAHHSVHTISSMWGEQQRQQEQWQVDQQGWGATAAPSAAAVDMDFEPSFGPSAEAAAAGLSSLRASASGLPPAAGMHLLPEDLVLRLPADNAQQQQEQQQQRDDSYMSTGPADDGASAAAGAGGGDGGSSGPTSADQGRRQRQRWQVPAISVDPDAPPPHDSAHASSHQGTPASAAGGSAGGVDGCGALPQSPSSLEVLRNVGQRVQHLLESLSRQTSNSSRQGSRSPWASQQQQQGRLGHGVLQPVHSTITDHSVSGVSSALPSPKPATSGADLVAGGDTAPAAAAAGPQDQPEHHNMQLLDASTGAQQQQRQADEVQQQQQEQWQQWHEEAQQAQAASQSSAAAGGVSAEPWHGTGLTEHASAQLLAEPVTPVAAAVAVAAQQRFSQQSADVPQQPGATGVQSVRGSTNGALASAVPQQDTQAGAQQQQEQLFQTQPLLQQESEGLHEHAALLRELQGTSTTRQEDTRPAGTASLSGINVTAAVPPDTQRLLPEEGLQGQYQQQEEEEQKEVADPAQQGGVFAAGSGEAATCAPQKLSAAEAEAQTAQLATSCSQQVWHEQHPEPCLSGGGAGGGGGDSSGLGGGAGGVFDLREAAAAPHADGHDVTQQLLQHEEQQPAVPAASQLQKPSSTTALQPVCDAPYQQQEPSAPVSSSAVCEAAEGAQGSSAADVQQWAGPSQQQEGVVRLNSEAALVEAAGADGSDAAQAPSMAAAATVKASFSMQYNQLFQPAASATMQESEGDALATAATRHITSGLSAAGASSAGAAAVDGSIGVQLPPAAPLATESSGLSKVDKALEKLQSLRSTLRNIGSSSGGSGGITTAADLVSSQVPPAGAGLTNEHTATSSLHLCAADASSSSVGLAAQSSSLLLLQDLSTAAVVAGTGPMPEPADMQLQDPAGGGDALSSAKDWIRQISQRLQQVGQAVGQAAAETTDGNTPTAAAVPNSGPEAAAGDAAGVTVQTQDPLPSPTSVAAQVEQLCSEPAQEPSTAQRQEVSGAAATAQDASSPGWSTLTAGTSSSGSIGSEHRDTLIEEQLHGTCEQEPPSQQPACTHSPVNAALHPEQLPAAAAEPHPDPAALQYPAGSAGVALQEPEQHALSSETAACAAEPSWQGEGAVVTLAASEHRLQQLLSQPDDTMLLMSFALKLDRLGQKFKPHTQQQGAAAAYLGRADSPLRLSAASPGGWQTQSGYGSPPRGSSPAGPWTSITHNSLYNASAASTPQKPAATGMPQGVLGASCRDEAATATAEDAAACSPTHGQSVEQAAGSLQAQQQPWQELQDAVLQDVLGVGLQQLQEGGSEAVQAVASTMSRLQGQLAEASAAAGLQWQPPSRQAGSGSSCVQSPALVLLTQDLRQAVRQRCLGCWGGARNLSRLAMPHSGGSVEEVFEEVVEQQVAALFDGVLPLVLQLWLPADADGCVGVGGVGC